MVQQLGVEEAMAILPAESGALDPLIDEDVNRMSTFMKVHPRCLHHPRRVHLPCLQHHLRGPSPRPTAS